MSISHHIVSRLRRLLRPEYWWQPAQLFRRIGRRRTMHGAEPASVCTAWGLPMKVNPRESTGRSLLALNTMDLPVAETIWRLLDAGDSCADIGANIGCMSSVMAARLCDGGRIWAFEPVPQLAERLRENVRSWESLSRAVVSVHEQAISDRVGPTDLFLPADFDRDKDNASLAVPAPDSSGDHLTVDGCTLDRFFADDVNIPHLIKIDVEGWESQVFRGAQRLLTQDVIRDIIYEEFGPQPAESTMMLRAHGYTVFRIARGFLRPRLVECDATFRFEIDPPSCLATRDPARAAARFQQVGWLSMRGLSAAGR